MFHCSLRVSVVVSLLNMNIASNDDSVGAGCS